MRVHFKFNNTSEKHSITINNNVLYQLQPIVDIGGTINKSEQPWKVLTRCLLILTMVTLL